MARSYTNLAFLNWVRQRFTVGPLLEFAKRSLPKRLQLNCWRFFAGEKLSVAATGELYAKRFLLGQGMHFIAANWRCRAGELDLVFSDGSKLIIVEVKTRLESLEGRKYLFESITEKKKRKLRILSELFVLQNFKKNHYPPVRIDAIGVILSREKLELLELKHLVGVI